MADTPTAFTEEGARQIIEEILRTRSLPRNDFHRRRRHVTGGGGSGSSDLVLFRLEEELVVGHAAEARIVNADSLVTESGETITVMDDERKWFGRGDPAPSGDAGGDARISGSSYSCCGWACKVVGDTTFYSILSMGTWYRWLQGVLSDGQDEHPWRVNLSDVSGWDGDLGTNRGYNSKFVRADDEQESGVAEFLTLSGACIDPVDGMNFKAVFDEIGRVYKVITLCCPEGA